MQANTAFIALGDLRKSRAAVSAPIPEAGGGCGTSGGEGKASCGSLEVTTTTSPRRMPAAIRVSRCDASP